ASQRDATAEDSFDQGAPDLLFPMAEGQRRQDYIISGLVEAPEVAAFQTSQINPLPAEVPGHFILNRPVARGDDADLPESRENPPQEEKPFGFHHAAREQDGGFAFSEPQAPAKGRDRARIPGVEIRFGSP